MNKWIVAALAAVAALHGAAPLAAQAPTREGYTLPMTYDSQGAQHFYTNGYSGEVYPPMAPQNHANSVQRRGAPRIQRAKERTHDQDEKRD